MELREQRAKRSNGAIKLADIYSPHKRLLVLDCDEAVIFSKDKYADDGNAYLAFKRVVPTFPARFVGADIFPDSPVRFDYGLVRWDEWLEDTEIRRLGKELFGKFQPDWWGGDLTRYYLKYRVYTASDRFLGTVAEIAERLIGDEDLL